MLAHPLCILESVGAEVVFSLPTYEIKNSFWYEWVCVFNNNMQPSATATLQLYGFHSTVDLSTWFVLFFSSDWQTADSASMANIQWIQSIQLQTGTIFSNKIDILHWMREKRTLWMSFQFNCSTSFFLFDRSVERLFQTIHWFWILGWYATKPIEMRMRFVLPLFSFFWFETVFGVLTPNIHNDYQAHSQLIWGNAVICSDTINILCCCCCCFYESILLNWCSIYNYKML